MNELQLRQSVVDVIRSWLGAVKGSDTHKSIIDRYNTIRPLPRGVRMSDTMPWCAATVSACFQAAGLIDLIPPECSCGLMLSEAKSMGIWQERDDYRPQLGDICLYDWQDSGQGNNTGAPDHVGIVTAVNDTGFTVIEGNKGNPSQVGERSMTYNGRYIRGFITPNYASKATVDRAWYQDAIDWARERGVVTTSLPEDVPTVAQVVQMLYNYDKAKGR